MKLRSSFTLVAVYVCVQFFLLNTECVGFPKVHWVPKVGSAFRYKILPLIWLVFLKLLVS
jgi:hypothetical protein